jgi:hypothetical protein
MSISNDDVELTVVELDAVLGGLMPVWEGPWGADAATAVEPSDPAPAVDPSPGVPGERPGG